MTVSRSKTAKAEELRISQIGDFKKRLGGVMELPSGLVVRLRNPGGLRAFMSKGNIPNSLMVIIQKALDKGTSPEVDELMPEGKVDPKLMDDMMDMMDTIAIATIVEPKLHNKLTEDDLVAWNKTNPNDQLNEVEELRQADRLYVDELPDDDKQFIFQWISGGTRDLEIFRQQSDASLDSVVAKSVVLSNAVSDDGTNAR